MLRKTSGLSRSASRWAFQVSSSLGATLIAALIVEALPRPTAPVPAPLPELTSGGKFAARIASAHAYDGLDTMPLPHADAPPVIPVAFLGAPPAALAGDDGALRQPAWDAPAALRDRAKVVRPARPPVRPEARRSIGPAEGSTAIPLTAAPAAVAAAADDGLLHRIVSTTGQAWTLTTSAGGALLSRLVP